MCVTEGVSAWTAGGPPSKQCRLTRQPLWSELSCSTAETVGLHWYFTSAENTHTQTWGPNALTHTHTVTKQECICGRSVLKFLLCSTLHVSSQFPPMFPISTPSFSRSNIKKNFTAVLSLLELLSSDLIWVWEEMLHRSSFFGCCQFSRFLIKLNFRICLLELFFSLYFKHFKA